MINQSYLDKFASKPHRRIAKGQYMVEYGRDTVLAPEDGVMRDLGDNFIGIGEWKIGPLDLMFEVRRDLVEGKPVGRGVVLGFAREKFVTISGPFDYLSKDYKFDGTRIKSAQTSAQPAVPVVAAPPAPAPTVAKDFSKAPVVSDGVVSGTPDFLRMLQYLNSIKLSDHMPGIVRCTELCNRHYRKRWHQGVDLAAPKGSPIIAWKDLTITRSASGGAGGNRIYVSDGTADFVFMHLSWAAKAGSYRKGDVIARSGDTGSRGSFHHHAEVRFKGVNRVLGRETLASASVVNALAVHMARKHPVVSVSKPQYMFLIKYAKDHGLF